MTTDAPRAVLLSIARRNFPGVEDFEVRHSDAADFHSVAIWCIEQALAEAYEAGRARQRLGRNG